MKPKRHPSQLRSSLTKGRGGSNDRFNLDRHKQYEGWPDSLLHAKAQWAKPQHDEAILAMSNDPGTFQDEEVQAAMLWECFRHLYFTRRLSVFWRELVEGNRHQAIRRLSEVNPSKQEEFLSSHPESFAAPWNAWADDPCFPVFAWSEAREKAAFGYALRVAPKRVPAALLPASLSACAWLYQAAAEESMKETFETVVDRMKTPLELIRDPGKNRSVIAVEIDWTAKPEEIIECLRDSITKLRKKRNPRGTLGRGDGDLIFFKGLVLRRRLDRDEDIHAACAGMYKLGEDRKTLTKHPQSALAFADDRLKQTLRVLGDVEEKLTTV